MIVKTLYKPKSWPGPFRVLWDIRHLQDEGMWENGVVPTWATEMAKYCHTQEGMVIGIALRVVAEELAEMVLTNDRRSTEFQ